MSYCKSYANGKPIDYYAMAERQIAKRVKEALEARDAAFAERHAETPLPQLAQYLKRCAETLKHSPSPNEVDGGAFIEERFGSWEAAMRLAKLSPPKSMRKLSDTARYKGEKARQEPLYREERKKKKQLKRERADQRKHEMAVKKRAEKAAQAEWEAKKKAEAEAKAAALEASLAENTADAEASENESVMTPIQEIICAEAAAEVLCAADAMNNDACPAAEPAAACAETSPSQAETV